MYILFLCVCGGGGGGVKESFATNLCIVAKIFWGQEMNI